MASEMAAADLLGRQPDVTLWQTTASPTAGRGLVWIGSTGCCGGTGTGAGA